jgi:26S proteasome regulatory subunit N3
MPYALQTPSVAKGFLISVHKWLTVIRLLLGEIPTRAEFDLPGMRGHLHPYFSLTAAVRSGDVTAFNAVAMKHEKVFQADHTHNLINRLRYNVLRAGLRRISVAYSRISLLVRSITSFLNF